ncbi:MAG: hypothetical protein M3Z97_05305 [Candidatus Dormibacteraeota bacterium]|nr:hypothetical protein [Candidatus Dormibacteraeota bacterium]
MSFQQPASAPPPPPGSPRSASRGGAGLALPLLLIAAGVLALLLNFGVVSSSQVVRVFALWPAALVLLGVVLVCRAWLPRLMLPLAAVLAVLLVVGAFAYSSLLPGAGATARSDYSVPLGQTEHGRLQVNLAASALTVRGQDMPDLYRAQVQYVDGHPPEVRVDNGTVSMQSGRGVNLFSVRGTTSARLSLNQSVPWDVEVSGGASRDTLELGSLHLTSLQLSGGAEQLDVTLPRPTGTIPVRISGGASSITVHRPSGVAARVRMSGGASNLTVDGNHRSVLGGDVIWESSDYGTAGDRYDFDISGGASTVTIDQR